MSEQRWEWCSSRRWQHRTETTGCGNGALPHCAFVALSLRFASPTRLARKRYACGRLVKIMTRVWICAVAPDHGGRA
jgi:hypothetical protein